METALGDDLLRSPLLSLQVSGLATVLSLLIGLPLGTALALGRFPGRAVLLSVVNTGMGLPPVVVGLVVAMLLWRSGPLGDLRLIYTPWAIVIAQLDHRRPGRHRADGRGPAAARPAAAAAAARAGRLAIRRWSWPCGTRRACRCSRR